MDRSWIAYYVDAAYANFELCPASTFYAFHDRGSVMGTDPYEAIGWALMATGWIAVKCERGAHFEIS